MENIIQQTQSPSTYHRHAKLWLAVTVAVVVVAGLLVWYFVVPAKVKESETPTTQTTTPSSLTSANEELKAVDINELKIAVEELKTTLAAFR